MPRININDYAGSGIEEIAEKVANGQRLDFTDGVKLFRSYSVPLIGKLANSVRERLHSDKAYYIRNQHINYTNICNKRCRFCSFYAKKGGPEPYTLSMEDVRKKLESYRHVPITEVHMVAGINPKLPYSYYLDLLKTVKEIRPDVTIKAFTMIELEAITQSSGKPLRETLLDLTAAGLGALPGGGVEVLSERVHNDLFGRKLDGKRWLATARVAHELGLKSNATLLYGHVETIEEIVEHLIKLRELQDETGGFQAFIPLAFHSDNTELEGIPKTTGLLDLKMIAISRLMLDNFPHIKSFWVMTGVPVAQVSLWYGADDIDGTIMEYEITKEDVNSVKQSLTQKQLENLIYETGRVPVERDSFYNPVSERIIAA